MKLHWVVMEVIRFIGIISLMLAIFNLLPILPLDGGHVVESLLVASKPAQGRVWARYLTLALCAVLGVLSAQHGYTWSTTLFVMFAIQAAQGLSLLKAQTELAKAVPVPPAEDRDVLGEVDRMHKLLEEDRPLEARAVAFQVLSRARALGVRDAALRVLAWVAIGQGEPQEALKQLAQTSKRFDDPFTWGTAIAASGDAQKALPHLQEAFARQPSPAVVANSPSPSRTSSGTVGKPTTVMPGNVFSSRIG